MGDIVNIANLVGDLNLLCAQRQAWSVFELKPFASTPWQTLIISHFFHKQTHIPSKSLLQL